jgi:hypothetical protein
LRGDAVREDGTLKEASEIEWLHSPSDEHNRLTPKRDGDTLRGDAMRENGTLKDASEIEWLHSPSDEYGRFFGQHEDRDGTSELEWPESPSTPSEHHSSFDKRKRQSSNESECEDEEAPKAKVS